MENKNIALIAVVLIAGFVAGFYFNNLIFTPQSKAKEAALRSFNYPMVQSVAFGEVTEINGNVVTLLSKAQKLQITITDRTNIVSYTNRDDKNFAAPTSTNKIESIKVGDTMNVSFRVGADNKLEAVSAIITNVKAPV